MLKIDNSTAVGTRPTIDPAGTEGWWTNGNPGGGIPATIIEADFLNDLQANLREVLDAGSITPTKGPGGDTDLLDALSAINALSAYRGRVIGALERVSASQLRIRPVVGAKVWAQIDGVIIGLTGALTIDMVADIEGTEAASTWYYLYVRNNAGVLEGAISATAPDAIGGTKPSYHPASGIGNGYVCCGSWYNDGSQNLVEGSIEDGRFTFNGYESWRFWALGTTVTTAWTTQALPLPETASKVGLRSHIGVNDAIVAFGRSTASVALANGSYMDSSGNDDVEHWNLWRDVQTANADFVNDSFDIPIADQSSPAIRWGIMDTGTGTCVNNDLMMASYIDPLFPRE